MSLEANLSLSIPSISEDEEDKENFMTQEAINFIVEMINNNSRKGYFYSSLEKTIKQRNKDYKEIDFYFCNKCKNILIFNMEPKNIINLDEISYSCGCDQKQKKIKLTELNELKINLPEIKSYLVCPNCGKKFSSFNNMEKKNICENCLNDKNYEELLNKFDGITILDNLNYLSFFAIDNKIDEINKENESIKEKMERLSNLKKLIISTILNYILYPNYNLYLTIRNFCEAFVKYSQSPDEPNDEHFFKKDIEINRDKKQLMKLNNAFNDYVSKVDVRQLKFRENLIEKYIIGKFKNLIELNLSENNLKSIESLTKVEWKNLQKLFLFINQLSDDNIPYISNLDAKELTTLNLNNNDFSNYEIFLAIGNNNKGSFKKLKELRLGNNRFKIIPKKINEIVNSLKNLDFSSIEILSLNNGGLSQKAAEKILPALNLKSWENIDLRYNYLTNLDFDVNHQLKKELYKEGNFIRENYVD